MRLLMASATIAWVGVGLRDSWSVSSAGIACGEVWRVPGHLTLKRRADIYSQMGLDLAQILPNVFARPNP
jgi:hypothetical protein